eukprot:scaffold2477_cov95-Isochrysis_galbana.AAC.3
MLARTRRRMRSGGPAPPARPTGRASPADRNASPSDTGSTRGRGSAPVAPQPPPAAASPDGEATPGCGHKEPPEHFCGSPTGAATAGRGAPAWGCGGA